MTILSALALFATMAALAAIPSSSVLLVVTQSTGIGLRNGIATAVGVVAGDLVFMMMAIWGMALLAEQMGAVFVVIKYLAAAYLIWFGIGLIRRHRGSGGPAAGVGGPGGAGRSLPASFAAGLLLTLGDLKAIFFYASLLPAFLDLSRLTAADIWLMSGITILAVGGVKVAYAIGAAGALRAARRSGVAPKLETASGALMVGVGGYILLRE